MTRTYAAIRLLEHGPLTFAQFREITGWPPREASRVLKNLHRTKKALCVNHQQHSVWRLP